jgi:hypothetical protein
VPLQRAAYHSRQPSNHTGGLMKHLITDLIGVMAVFAIPFMFLIIFGA